MRIDDFEFIIVSPVDREKLTCELYYQNEIIAEISQETNEFILEIYSSPTSQWWTIPLIKFQKALEYAEKYLIEGSTK